MKLTLLRHARSKPPWRVLFFGTDDFSLQVLQALSENMMSGSNTKCVVGKLCVAHPFKKKLTPVNRYADFCGIFQYEWPFNHHLKGFDVGVLASFGHLIPRKVINMFPYGIVNVHPSLLPRWRGAAPLHHTVLQGDTTTGVSIMALEPKHFDRGQLLLQQEISAPSKSTTHSLRDLLGPIGGRMILDVLSSLPESLELAQPQQNIQAATTYAHKVNQTMSFIDWHNQTCDELDRHYRAVHQTMELRSEWNGTTVRMLEMVDLHHNPCIPLDESSQPGMPVFSKQENILWVKCKDGWVGFGSIMMKKKMTAKSFYNGYLSKKNMKGILFRSISSGLFDPSYFEWIKNPRPS